MPNWLLEILTVFWFSQRTRGAFILGMVVFVGVQILGIYALADFKLHGPSAALTDAIKQLLAGKYDEVSWAGLISFWALAFKFYWKDRIRFL